MSAANRWTPVAAPWGVCWLGHCVWRWGSVFVEPATFVPQDPFPLPSYPRQSENESDSSQYRRDDSEGCPPCAETRN